MINRNLTPVCCSNLGMASEYLAAKVAKGIEADVLIYLGNDDGIKGEDGKVIPTINIKEYVNNPGNPNFEKIMGASHFQGPTLIANGMDSLLEDIVLMRTGTKLSYR